MIDKIILIPLWLGTSIAPIFYKIYKKIPVKREELAVPLVAMSGVIATILKHGYGFSYWIYVIVPVISVIIIILLQFILPRRIF